MNHKLLEKNIETLAGVCQVCGPVELSHRKDRDTYLCKPGMARWRQPKYRSKEKSTAGHGLSRDEATTLRDNSSCAICGSIERLAVDHCHETGRIRGVLCGRHNMALGLFKDNVNDLASAITYLGK